jgi:vacuolar-type H+-ATPase subunit E/Vma4
MATEQEQKLQREILADAERKARRIIDRAQRDAEKMLESEQADNQALRELRLEDAEREAGERAQAILASIEQERRRRWLIKREEVIAGVIDAALQELQAADSETSRLAMTALLAQALAALNAMDVRLLVSPVQVALVREIMPAAVTQALGKGATGSSAAVVIADPAIAGGVVVETSDGSKRYDNTYSARLARLGDELRVEILSLLAPNEQEGENGGSEDRSKSQS